MKKEKEMKEEKRKTKEKTDEKKKERLEKADDAFNRIATESKSGCSNCLSILSAFHNNAYI